MKKPYFQNASLPLESILVRATSTCAMPASEWSAAPKPITSSRALIGKQKQHRMHREGHFKCCRRRRAHVLCVCKGAHKKKTPLCHPPECPPCEPVLLCVCVACACVCRKATTRRDDKHAFEARAMPAVCVLCMSRPPRGSEQAHRATPPTMHPTWLCGHHPDAPTTCGGAARRRPFMRQCHPPQLGGKPRCPTPASLRAPSLTMLGVHQP